MLFFIPLGWLPAQSNQLDLKRLTKSGPIEIPFDIENDFVVIDVFIDNAFPLRFLVDTGAENTIILDKTITDFLDVSYRRTYNVTGADMDTILTAYLATGVNLRLDNVLLARNRSLLVLKDNYFRFERITGTNIHGILGGDFLMRFVVEFDFRRQKLVLHEPNRYHPTRQHQPLNATFVRNRPYLDVPISISGRAPVERRLLLDTGAGLFVLLYTGIDDTTDLPQQIIPTEIAHGLGGAVTGNVGRAKSVQLGEQQFGDVITYFQKVLPFQDSIQLEFREGIAGNALWRRFNLVIDYVRESVYVRPTRRWRKPISFDRSGLVVAAGGRELHTFLITSVIPGTPAAQAGLRPGDRIKKVNGTPAALLTLNAIIRRLERKPGSKIKLHVKRLNQDLKFEFRLRDLI